jgi:hypothetical protein
MDNGHWARDSGQETMDTGQETLDIGQLTIDNWQICGFILKFHNLFDHIANFDKIDTLFIIW